MIFIAVLYAAATAVLLTFGLNLFWLALKHRAQGGIRQSPTVPAPGTWPLVTVQLPVYNERFVVDRLIETVALLDYPKDRFEIQVLDDSTDETSDIIAGAISRWKQEGVQIHHIRRGSRDGYKAGALSHGLETAIGEFIAIFDADFLPKPDFLKRMVPHLASDQKLGLVQARWGHINANDSVLTTVQATLLDTHFVVEQDVRNALGFLMNFNGTAGIWRKSCIADAGGWRSDTLTEDLDLSYRAQLNGWAFRYLADVEVPAEIPKTVSAWRQQQFRWTKGSVETSRKILKSVWRAPLERRQKVQSTIHLTGFLVFPAILIAVLFHAPLLVAHANDVGPSDHYFGAMGLGIFAFIGVVFAHISALRALYPDWRRRFLREPVLLATSLGLSVNNTRGILEAAFGRVSPFVRTPKIGYVPAEKTKMYSVDAVRAVVWTERVLALYSLSGLVALLAAQAWAGVGFQLMFVAGFGLLGWYDEVGRYLKSRRQKKRVLGAREALGMEAIHSAPVPVSKAA